MHETLQRVSAPNKIRPIIFSGPMVRALLEGRKTQTRRLLKPQPKCDAYHGDVEQHPKYSGEWFQWIGGEMGPTFGLPYAVGDLLWVKENHYRTDDGHNEFAVYAVDEAEATAHLASIDELRSVSDEVKARHRKLRPSIHMPRWASRITLEVTGVRVERLQDISDNDAIAEGLESAGLVDHAAIDLWCSVKKLSDYPDIRWPVRGYAALWDHINGAGAWDANPWIVAITFKVHRLNVRSASKGPEAA